MDTIDVITDIRNQKRADAIQKINDLLYNKASEAMSTYKQIVADTFFDSTEEEVKEYPEEETEQ